MVTGIRKVSAAALSMGVLVAGGLGLIVARDDKLTDLHVSDEPPLFACAVRSPSTVDAWEERARYQNLGGEKSAFRAPAGLNCDRIRQARAVGACLAIDEQTRKSCGAADIELPDTVLALSVGDMTPAPNGQGHFKIDLRWRPQSLAWWKALEARLRSLRLDPRSKSFVERVLEGLVNYEPLIQPPPRGTGTPMCQEPDPFPNGGPYMRVLGKAIAPKESSKTNFVVTCSATVIRPGLLLTAAHCVKDDKVTVKEHDTPKTIPCKKHPKFETCESLSTQPNCDAFDIAVCGQSEPQVDHLKPLPGTNDSNFETPRNSKPPLADKECMLLTGFGVSPDGRNGTHRGTLCGGTAHFIKHGKPEDVSQAGDQDSAQADYADSGGAVFAFSDVERKCKSRNPRFVEGVIIAKGSEKGTTLYLQLQRQDIRDFLKLWGVDIP